MVPLPAAAMRAVGSEREPASRAEERVRPVWGVEGGDVAERVAIHVLHQGCLAVPVREVVLVLEDAEGVDPEIARAEASDAADGVLEYLP